MLKLLRKGRTVQFIIVGFLSATCLVWGIGFFSSRQQPLYAGKIFDRKISWADYSRTWELTRQNLREIYRVDLPKELVDANTWSRLLLITEGKRRHITIPDTAVVERIRSISLFQRDGQFDRTIYETFLKFRHASPRAFEEAIREDLAIAKLRESVLSEITVSETDIRDAYRKTYEEARVSYLFIDPATFTDQAQREVAPEALRAYYDGHLADFTQPEEVDIDYLSFRMEDLPVASVTEEALQAYYTTHQQQLAPTEPGSTPPATMTPEVRRRVQQILQTQQREDAFDQLADKVSDRMAGKRLEEVGTLFDRPVQSTGFFQRDQPVPGIGKAPEVSEAAFRLKPAQTSAWIDTEHGGHIIRVKQARPARPLHFEEAQGQVQAAWVTQRARELAKATAAEVAATAAGRLAAGESWETIAQGLGLPLQKPAPFTRTGYIAGLGTAKGFAEAVFRLNPGEVSGATEVPTGYAVVRLEEFLPFNQERYAKERPLFAETLLRQKQEAHFEAWMNDLKARANLISYVDGQPQR